MTRSLQLLLSFITIILISTIIELLSPGKFFIFSTIGLSLVVMYFYLKKEKTNLKQVNLSSSANSHLQKMQELGQLSTVIAHDFNNILLAIKGHAELLIAQHNSNDLSYKYAKQIKENSERAAGLIKQLLSFSRKSQITPTPVDVGQTIKNLHLLMDQLVGDSVLVSIQCEEGDMFVLVDSTQFEQIIINLIVNARDAMNGNTSRGGVIMIKVKSVQFESPLDTEKYFSPLGVDQIPEGEYVKLTINDNGTGIKREILEKIFEPFFSTKDQQGTGLGLATVAQIVQKMGGYIFVETQDDVGTSFHIYLKRLDYSAVSKEAPKSINKLNKNDKFDKNHQKILVVEDEKSVCLFNSMALKSAGHQVDAVLEADEALDLVEKQQKQYDIIITDIYLGHNNGYELAKKIKSTLPNLRVIFTSGYDKQTIRDEGLQDSDFLYKPYSLEELMNAIEKKDKNSS